MLKIKLSFILVISLSIFLFSNSQITFANENIYEKGDYSVKIEINDSFYEVVSEDEVILDYMEKENVDRDTAINELRITDNELYNTLSSCTTQWRHYTSSKKQIESSWLSGVELTLSPYIRVKNCNGNETFLTLSSAQPGYAFYGLLSFSAHLTTANAIKTSSTQLRFHASGYIDPIIGLKRYWNWEHCMLAKTTSGNARCF